MSKSLKIEVPEGYEIDKEESTFENIVFKKKEDDWPETWEDLGVISGYFVSTDSELHTFKDGWATPINANVFATKEQAKASLALAQLSQLMKRVNGDWEPDYEDLTEKWLIAFKRDVPQVASVFYTGGFLTFPSYEIAEKFLEKYRDLIEQAKPLL